MRTLRYKPYTRSSRPAVAVSDTGYPLEVSNPKPRSPPIFAKYCFIMISPCLWVERRDATNAVYTHLGPLAFTPRVVRDPPRTYRFKELMHPEGNVIDAYDVRFITPLLVKTSTHIFAVALGITLAQSSHTIVITAIDCKCLSEYVVHIFSCGYFDFRPFRK